MAFDQPTRNRLARFVGEARALLTAEFTRQLQHEYGLDPARGEVTELAKLTQLDDARRETARILRDTLAHYLAGQVAPTAKVRQEALDRLVREQAFTVLNRLCALRMAEARGLLIESIAKGYQSRGFQLYARLAGTALGETGEAYRAYLFSLFDEFGVDLAVLFDRFSPQGRLFPRASTLLQLLAAINHVDLEPLWAEDETIGWIYQYFNSKEERKAMRDASQAPRNSRELAVRNQFFTPRYVVEFLTDNTLGRIWYEMTQGRTSLVDSCRYLVRRPNEIFLNEGEEAPTDKVTGGPGDHDLTQEELLRQPVYIPFRQIKDPRTILMLDPACGSMHFGLYSFDLYERIYEEAWEFEGELGVQAFQRPAAMAPLRERYPDKARFLRDVPRLIIEHNIHGIDIDPRAVQIAGLSLWLRAQKSWQAQGLKPQERPTIRKSNIVCAEPMPGDKALLEEFLQGLRSDRLEALIRRVLNVPENQRVRATPTMADALCDLVRTVWEEMKLAGDAGSLLRIEEALSEAIASGRAEWEEKMPLFRVETFRMAEDKPKVNYAKAALNGQADFWSQAEFLVLNALEEYSSQAENTERFSRRLFAKDATRGFAFIDICRKHYDLVLMNPPFGDASENSKKYVFSLHEREKTELGACFITRTSTLAPLGMVGIISNRTFLFADSFQEWRQRYLKNLALCADLGFGVLDALVETSASVIRTDNLGATYFVALTNSNEKDSELLDTVVESTKSSINSKRLYIRTNSTFEKFGTEWFYYWLQERFLQAASSMSANKSGLLAKPGLQTCDNFRFVRLFWEVPIDELKSRSWIRLSKGGEYQPFWADVHLVAWWKGNGAEMKAFIEGAYESWSKQIPSIRLYFLSGLTYSERTTSSLSLRIFPQNCLFDKQGPFVGYPDSSDMRSMLLIFLGISYCYSFRSLVETKVGLRDATEAGSPARHYMPSMIETLPLPIFSLTQQMIIKDWVLKAIKLQREIQMLETNDSMHYAFPELAKMRSILKTRDTLAKKFIEQMLEIYAGLPVIEEYLDNALKIDNKQQEQLEVIFGRKVVRNETTSEAISDQQISSLLNLTEPNLVNETTRRVGFYSSILKQSHVVNRRVELIAMCLNCAPENILKQVTEYNWLISAISVCINLIESWIGMALGQWDIRYTTGEKSINTLPDPFESLPATPPGMLQNY